MDYIQEVPQFVHQMISQIAWVFLASEKYLNEAVALCHLCHI